MLKSKTSKFSRTGLILFSALIVYSIFTSAASAGTATLSWSPPTTNADGSPLTDLAGYKVYYGTSSKTYTSSVNVGNVTSYTTANLADGTYYFAVTAIDTSNIESGYSNEASKSITTTVTTASTGTAILSWTPPTANTDGSQITDLAGYKVYYGTSSQNYTSSVNIGNVTTYTANLAAGTYYFAITSYDTSGNESSYSTEVSKAIGGTGGTTDTTPPTGTISVNSGAMYTNNTATSLALSCSDAGGCSQMQFSNDNATWSTAEAYSTTKSWTLTSTNGTTTVYAKFKDNAGNWSTAYSDTITLDTVPPTVSINAVSTPTTTSSQTVTGTIGSGTTVSVSTNTTASDGAATVSGTSWSYTITGLVAGVNNITVTAKDAAGNTATANSSITLNSTATSTGTTSLNIAPSANVTVSSQNSSTGQLGTRAIDGIVDGYPGDYTKEWATVGQLADAWITLTWNQPQQISQIRLYDRPNPSDNILSGTLLFSDGSNIMVGALPSDGTGFTVSLSPKSVTWVTFRVDSAVGVNIGLAEFEVTPTSTAGTSDTTLPTGTVSINSGAAYTNNTLVTLTLSCSDSGGCSQMQFSNDNATWSTAEPYSATKSWTLTTANGTKTVYAKFKDNAGNWSTAYSDIITLDTVPPMVSINAVSALTTTSSQTVTGTMESGASVYVSTDTAASDGAASMSGTSWSYTITGLAAGVNTVTVTARDAAGNTATASTSITLNAPLFTSTSPASSAFINTGMVGYTLSRAANTGTITFTRTGGSADLTSPYVYNFTASDVTAGTHSVNTGINLVSGAVYSIVFAATDLSGKKESVAISNVTYDAKAASVVINSPVSNSIVNNASVSYTLSENISTGEIAFTGNDRTSPHTYEMTSADRTAGAHTIDTGALLLDGVLYTVAFQNITDIAGNPTSAMSNTNIKYDNTSVVISNTTPVPGSAITSATVGYTLSEQASTGKVTFTRTGGKNDRNSPQVYYFNYSDLTAGAHTVNTNLPLVRGTTYTVSFDAVDLIGNKSTTVSNGEVTYKGR